MIGVLAITTPIAACANSSDNPASVKPQTTVVVVQEVVTTQPPAPEPAAPSPPKQSPSGFADRSPSNKVIPAAAVETVWVPALCGNSAGHLIDGKLPKSLHGNNFGGRAELMRRGDGSAMGAYADINNDGKDEAVIIYSCDHGGISWPDNILVYDNDLNFIREVSVDDRTEYQPDRSHIRALRWDANSVEIDWDSMRKANTTSNDSYFITSRFTMPMGEPHFSILSVGDKPEQN